MHIRQFIIKKFNLSKFLVKLFDLADLFDVQCMLKINEDHYLETFIKPWLIKNIRQFKEHFDKFEIKGDDNNLEMEKLAVTSLKDFLSPGEATILAAIPITITSLLASNPKAFDIDKESKDLSSTRQKLILR